jgi:hypothetical protein
LTWAVEGKPQPEGYEISEADLQQFHFARPSKRNALPLLRLGAGRHFKIEVAFSFGRSAVVL